MTSVPARWCISGQISLTGRGAAVMCKRLCELTAFLLFAKALAFRQHRFRRPQVRARSAQPRRDQHHQHRQQQTNDKQPHDLRCFHVLSFSSHRHHRCPRATTKAALACYTAQQEPLTKNNRGQACLRAGGPKAIVATARKLAERVYHVQHWTQMPRGGHFPALEEPELLVEDIRTFFQPLRKSAANKGTFRLG